MDNRKNSFLQNHDDPVDDMYLQLDSAPVVIVPIPYEKTVTYHKGTSKAPEQIIEASSELELFDIELKQEIIKYIGGIYTSLSPKFSGLDEKSSLKNIEEIAHTYFSLNKFPVFVGGEHTITLPIVRAMEKNINGEISIIHLDAHPDLRDEFEGNKYNHACVFRRIHELIGDNINIIHMGMRTASLEENEYVLKNPIDYYDVYDLNATNSWYSLMKRKIKKNVYLSIDADFFDWEIMRAVGTPEPGGLGWNIACRFLKEVFVNHNVVGFDLVEVCPDATVDSHSQFASAKLIYKLIGYKFCLL